MLRSISAISATLLLVGCGLAIPHPHDEPAPGYDAQLSLMYNMNRDVLTRERYDRLIVEVDFVTGAAPAPRALAELRETLERYVPEGYAVDVELDDEIPPAKWEALQRSGPDGYFELLREHADRAPSPETRTHCLYVLYLPDVPGLGGERYAFFARAEWEPTAGTAAARPHLPYIVMGKAPIQDRAPLWLSGDALEASILVHELGHFFGLVGNAQHQTPGAHCTNPRCPMQRGVWRTALANFYPAFFAGRLPTEYGEQCRSDIEWAKRGWADPMTRARMKPIPLPGEPGAGAAEDDEPF